MVVVTDKEVCPLKGLKPEYNERTGRRNWRLFFCTLHALLIESSTNYAPSLLVIYLTAKFKFKPDQTGFFLAFLCLSYTFTTVILVPAVISLLRPLYKRRAFRQRHLADSELPDQDTISDSTDHLDIHIAVFSLILEAIGYILFSFMTTRTGQYISVLIIALGGGAKAVFRSVVAASVEPLKQGETLAAVEMVASIGMVISPLYMGAVFSATIISIPTLIFYTNGLVTLLGVFVLFLIKDADRYTSNPPALQEVDTE